VILQEDRSAPVVAIQYWVKAGSRTETDREAGITHLIEHMIFKGTPSRGVGEVAWTIEAAGGEINAYTTLDYTVYHVAIASRFARIGLEVLSDAVRNALFDAGELEREKKVVLEEIRRGEDRPAGRLQKALFSTRYGVHPYRRPVIGYPETVSAFSREDLLDYAARLYVPENVTLIMTGDLDPAETLGLVRSLMGDWVPRPARPPQVAAEPPQTDTRAVILRQEASEAHLQMAFPIPGARHGDVPALDLLALILGAGDSSRLERRVRSDQGLVHGIGAYAYTPMDDGLLGIQCTLDPDKVHEAMAAIFQEVFRIRQEGVTAEELDKARINVEADLIQGKETMQGKARVMGQFQLLYGDSREEQAYLEAIRSVSREELQRVAGRYLFPERLTVALLIPPGSRVEISPEAAGQAARDAALRARAPGGGRGAEAGGAVRKEVLDNGLTVLIKELRDVPTVSIRAAFLGGSRFETAETAGINAFISQMLTRGTAHRSAEQVAREVESVAGSLQGFSGRNSLGIEAEFLSRFFPQGMELFSDVLLHPTFDPGEMEKERTRLLAAIRRELDQPAQMAFQLFARTLFRVHPYGLRRMGSEASVTGLQQAHLRAYYERVVAPGNGVLAVVGDVAAAEALRWVRRYLGSWQVGAFTPPPVPQEPPLQGVRQASEVVAKQQVHLVLGFPGTRLGSPDQVALQVLDTVLSGQGGRLFKELRDRQGLAYSVTSFSQVGLDPAYFGTYIATAPENRDRALEGLWRELKRVTAEAILPEELERAKRHVVGSYEIAQQTHGAQATSMALDELYGLGFDFGGRFLQAVEGVTRQDVLEAARKYIDPGRHVLVTVGPSP
jgi:zinc protease